jgi:DNA helicase-2/ATP-dependent DNA helicase PcrA
VDATRSELGRMLELLGDERVSRLCREWVAQDPTNVYAAHVRVGQLLARVRGVREMDPEQRLAIEHGEGPCVLMAQAGSGKTRALVHRIVRLVDREVAQESILAVTFGRRTRDEMNERLVQMGIGEARVSTWHSLCLQILKQDHTRWEFWEVDSHNRARYVLKDAIGHKHLDWASADLGDVVSYVGMCKANLLLAGSDQALAYAESRFGKSQGPLAADAYVKYQELIEERALLTYDDFLVFAWQHLSTDDQVRRRWAARWQYILQDEAQDANLAQVVIAEMLARDHRNYMVVGDVAQSIFGFRGSKPDYLSQFAETWGARTISMCRNYRSGAAIVRAANNVIQTAKVRAPGDMIAERGVEGDVSVLSSRDFDEEGRNFADWVSELVGADGAKYGECAALYRANAQSRALEESLLSRKIPYVVVGGGAFYERREVRDLLSYLRVAARHGDVMESVRQCINSPFRFLGKAFVQKLVDGWDSAIGPTDNVRAVARGGGIQRRQVESALEWSALVEELVGMLGEGPAGALALVVNRTRYIDWVKRDEGDDSVENDRAQVVQELLRTSVRFATVESLLSYVDSAILVAKKQGRGKPAKGRVILSTIHKSKGLEWPHVFVAGCNDGVLPHAFGDPEEERRLMYVAVTRARDNLVLSYVRIIAKSSGEVDAEPSPFISDAMGQVDEVQVTDLEPALALHSAPRVLTPGPF